MTIVRWVMLGVLVLGAANATGCAFFRPTTEISVNPINKTIRYINTKDTEGQLKGLRGAWTTADGGSGSFELAELSASDKSSPVLERIEKTMLAFVEQQKAGNEGIRIAMSGLAELANQVVPLVGMLRTQTSEMVELQTLLGTLRKQITSTPMAPTVVTQPITDMPPATQPAAAETPVEPNAAALAAQLQVERDSNAALALELAELRAMLVDGPSGDKSTPTTRPGEGTP